MQMEIITNAPHLKRIEKKKPHTRKGLLTSQAWKLQQVTKVVLMRESFKNSKFSPLKKMIKKRNLRKWWCTLSLHVFTPQLEKRHINGRWMFPLQVPPSGRPRQSLLCQLGLHFCTRHQCQWQRDLQWCHDGWFHVHDGQQCVSVFSLEFGRRALFPACLFYWGCSTLTFPVDWPLLSHCKLYSFHRTKCVSCSFEACPGKGLWMWRKIFGCYFTSQSNGL